MRKPPLNADRAVEQPAHAQPLEASFFAALMQCFPASLPDHLAVAVSGGPDSMALAFCLQRWAAPLGKTVHAMIVDHRLRPESTQESQTTQKTLTSLGLLTEILTWEHDSPATRLHSRARKARYDLLIKSCQRQNIRHLLLGHHKDDQAETILMRFAKGSGIDGLAGMAAQSLMAGIHLWRPFLTLPKTRLVATCIEAGIPFITDPSNESDRFARGRLRRVMPLLAAEGFTIDRLLDLSTRAAVARDALEHATQTLLATAMTRNNIGVITLDRTVLRSAPVAIAERALSHCLQKIHAADYPPEHASLDDLCKRVRSQTSPIPTCTLHGCAIHANATTITLMREIAAIKPMTIQRGETILWDQQWRVTLTDKAPENSYTIRPLGSPPHALIDRLAPALRKKIPRASHRALLPALWSEENLAIIPAEHKEASAMFIAEASSPI